MNNIKPSIVILLSLSCLIGTTYVSAALGPGYVSRDCPAFGAKESITLDWSEKKHWFKTISMHAFPLVNGDNTKVSWFPYFSDSPSQYRAGWDFTKKAYAGSVLNYPVNNSYSRVVGYHYWFNPNGRRIEVRTSDVMGCNLTAWGTGDWDGPETFVSRALGAAYGTRQLSRFIYRTVLEWF